MGTKQSRLGRSNTLMRTLSDGFNKRSVNKRNIKPLKSPLELTEKDYEFFETQTPLSKSEIKDIFERFHKDNPSGKLNRENFIKLYGTFRAEPAESLDKISQKIFNCFDLNKNGYLEFHEFLIGYALTSRGDLRKRLEYAFWVYDQDQNGYLDSREIEIVMNCMISLFEVDKCIDSTAEISNFCINELDVVKDGRLSKDEFVDGLLKNYYLRSVMSPFN